MDAQVRLVPINDNYARVAPVGGLTCDLPESERTTATTNGQFIVGEIQRRGAEAIIARFKELLE